MDVASTGAQGLELLRAGTHPDLVLVDEDNRPVPGVLHQIGSDGGFLPAPVRRTDLTIGVAERFDACIGAPNSLDGRHHAFSMRFNNC